jgi:tetratricopeptide (TPR) repeat protein
MRRILVGVIVLVILFCGRSLSADVVVSYASGDCSVDVQGTGTWVRAEVHLQLKEDSLLRTGSDGKMEIAIDEAIVAIGSETTVPLRSLLENMQSREQLGWFESFSERLDQMLRNRDRRQETAALGVRGKSADEEEITWMDDGADLEGDLKKCREYYERGEYGEVISLCRTLLRRESSAPIRHEIDYYLGAALFNSLQYEEALPFLGESIEDREVYFREPALGYYAVACFFTGEHQRAIDGFITFLEEFEGGELAPYAILMLGKSYKAMGDFEQALTCFREIEQHYAGTAVYDDAVGELQGL